MRISRKIFITLFLIGAFCVSGFVSISSGTAGPCPGTAEGDCEKWSDRLVAHAMGAPDSVSYTNSLEGFEDAYKRGLRSFEADLSFTSDGEIVLIHDWNSYLSLDTVPGEVLTHDEFMSIRIRDRYTPLDWKSVLGLLFEYPDIWIVTDSKSTDEGSVKAEFTRMVDEAQEYGLEEVLGRVIVQIYNPDMLSAVESVHHFDNYIFTLYQIWFSEDPADFESFCAFSAEHGIGSICMWYYLYNDDIRSIAEKYGINVYLHTVNDQTEADAFYAEGVTGVYTDVLSPQ